MADSPMTAVVLAGGEGRRLQPYTTVLPKPLMPLGDKSILEIVLRQLALQGFDEVILAVGYLAELIEAFAGDGSRFGIRVRYVREAVKLGTAGPLARIEDLPDPVLVMNGDVLTDINYRDLVTRHVESEAAATIAVVRRDEPIDFGVVGVGEGGRVESWTEKPVVSNLISTGINVVSASAVEMIPDDCAFDVPELVRSLLDRGLPVATFEMSGAWLDIGRKDDYERALEAFESDPGRYLPT